MPADPHHPQVGNLQISANAKTFGKQATRQHDRHRKHVRYRITGCGERVSFNCPSHFGVAKCPQAGPHVAHQATAASQHDVLG
jgi:hypothetical protein